jgi:Leucine-rich repeat (LRR) protein
MALMRRNPGFDGKLTPTFDAGVVTGLAFLADHVTDISPVQVLTGLKVLQCQGSKAGLGRLANLAPLGGMKLTELMCKYTQVSDLSPLKGMELITLWCTSTRVVDLAPLEGMPLSNLQISQTRVADLSPLRGMPLTVLTFNVTIVSNLSPLKGMKLKELHCSNTPVADLSPLEGMPLTSLWLSGTKVTDLSPLKNMPLTDLHFDGKPDGGTEIVRALTLLKKINKKPAAEFWKEVGEKQAADQAWLNWLKRVAALTAKEQIEEVRKELMRLNPGFDGQVRHKIEEGVVTELTLDAANVTDISPIRVFDAVRVLRCAGTSQRPGALSSVAALAGMNFSRLTSLNLSWTNVGDQATSCFKDCTNLTELHLQVTKVGDAGLAHFRGCQQLVNVDLGSTRVSDAGLAYLKDCKRLTYLRVGRTKVGDSGLAHVKGMPLKVLYIYGTAITDLTPLEGMPLEQVRLTPKNITRGLELLRDSKSLKTIGVDTNLAWPAAEFWERYDKGEFGKAALSFTDADVQRIAALPAALQVEEVRKE